MPTDLVNDEQDVVMLDESINVNMAHLTVVESVIHQQAGEQPTATETRFTRRLCTGEQAFTRKMTVGPTWQELEVGWLPRASMAVLANLPAKYLTMPTEQQKEDDMSKVVEVTFKKGAKVNRDMHSPPIVPPTADILIAPGESCRFAPASAVSILVRSPKGEIKLDVTLVPE